MYSLSENLILKWLASLALLIHLAFRLISPENNVAVDLLLFNLVGLLTAGISFKAPILTDRISAISIGLAASIWSLGSFFSTWNSFFRAQVPDGI